jgi:hypothetical protein
MRSFVDKRPFRIYTKLPSLLVDGYGASIFRLAGGDVIFISPEDANLVGCYGWYSTHQGYCQAVLETKSKSVFLH